MTGNDHADDPTDVPSKGAAPDLDPSAADPSGGARRAPRLRLALGVVLTLALVASACLFVWLLAQRRGEADAEQLQREEVMAQAEQFMLRVNTYGPDLLQGEEMPAYRKQVSAVISPKFNADFLKNVTANEQVVAQSQLSRTCQVFATGVSVIDEDSATALVAGAFVNSYPKTPGATERVAADPSPFRVEVRLVRSNGHWLVDDFDPVTGTGTDQGAQPGGTPSQLPSIVPETTGPTPEPTTGATP